MIFFLFIAVHIRADKNNKAGYPIEFILRNLLVLFFIIVCLLNLQCGKQIDGLSAIRHFFVILPHKKRNLDITL